MKCEINMSQHALLFSERHMDHYVEIRTRVSFIERYIPIRFQFDLYTSLLSYIMYKNQVFVNN